MPSHRDEMTISLNLYEIRKAIWNKRKKIYHVSFKKEENFIIVDLTINVFQIVVIFIYNFTVAFSLKI